MRTRFIVILLLFCLVLPDCLAENIPPDYSNHAVSDEAEYITVLADPAKLKEGKPVFAMSEPAGNWSGWMKFAGFSKEDDIWGYDVRSCDISNEDLSVVTDVNKLSFNSDTVWPETMPADFNPQEILSHNKNPGLGIRALHDQGITGDGVSIAIIDQPLLLDHEQYKDKLVYYERIHCIGDEATMHGPAVASIAVGKDIGTAPGAKLYYIASTFGHFEDNDYEFDASIIADCILRVLEINGHLPEGEKIRVISVSKGYWSGDIGYQEITDAIRKAEEENIFVITTSTEEYYDFELFGMNRDYDRDPDDVKSYLPAGWVAEKFYANPDVPSFQSLTMVPMGSRTYAGCTGVTDYEIGHEGGLSWAVPWCAGFYAMCCQVKPDLTSQEFIDIVKSTSVTKELNHDGKTYPFGKIVNPAAVIDQL